MRSNSNLALEGDRIVLVPYRKEHVERYHEWMKDPFLQEMTASEPLTLEEEYEMQESWAEDADKCTFIVLDKATEDTPGTGSHGGGMAGDTNLFLNDPENPSAAEIEVMIAEPGSRGKGLGKEAVKMMMAYGSTALGIATFVAKIGEANAPSLGLFSSLGFQEVSRSEVFKEVTLELKVQEGGWRQQLGDIASQWQQRPYDDGDGGGAGGS